ncbi:DBH-like monooxygenase protein 1 homolog [Oratosquilla oratoria]|uniref:DBH-like monooxygenase protein 1 homolog n=1 Tax=Oratosquilla oratoria TaxID=337810 RepID=UPI003F758E80
MKWSIVLCLLLWMARNSSCKDVSSMQDNTDYEPKDFEHSTGLDRDGILHLHWKVDFEKKLIRFLLSGRTQGWLGLGLSPKGGMAGADMITAWVDDEGRGHLQDRYGVGNTFPPVDERSDWRLLWSRRNETHTDVVVERLLDTCDELIRDIVITYTTKRLIYAWGETRPSTVDGSDLSYHGPVKRGVRFAMLLKPGLKPAESMMTPDIKTWVIEGSQYLRESSDTIYWCTVVRPPAQEHPTDTQYVGVRMEHGENSLEHLHHIVAYECPEDDGAYPTHSPSNSSSHPMEQYLEYDGHQCYQPNMPPNFVRCNNHYIIWAVGDEGEYLPEHIGAPLHKKEEHSYFLVEAHYDNPALKHGVFVSWQLHVFYTEKLRPNALQSFMIGKTLRFGMMIPPGQKSWMQVGHCPTECLAKGIPEDGIRIYSSYLHGHLMTRSIKVRHFRDGIELPPVSEDFHFDFNYQTTFPLEEERVVLPGDHFTVECVYDSTDRSKVTFAGLSTYEEMCLAFIYYYPATAMVECTSTTHPNVLKDFYDIDKFKDESQLYIADPHLEPFDIELPTKNTTFRNWLQARDWRNDSTLSLSSRNKLNRSLHLARCTAKGGKVIQVKKPETSYPYFRKYSPPPRRCEMSSPPQTVTVQETTAGSTVTVQEPTAGSTVTVQEPTAGSTVTMQEPTAGSTVTVQEPTAGSRCPLIGVSSVLLCAGCLLSFFRNAWFWTI